MISSSRRKTLLTRTIKWCLVLAFVASLFPIPIGKAKDTDEAYPCMHCACGCSSADQCWQACCCFNDEQKLDWARRNGVEPPAWFLDKMQHEQATPVNACCSKAAEKTCCQTKKSAANTSDSCCRVNNDLPSAMKPNVRKKPGVRWIVVDDALRCRGGFAKWDTGIPKLPSEGFLLLSASLKSPEGLAFECEFSSVGLSPPTLPPRALC